MQALRQGSWEALLSAESREWGGGKRRLEREAEDSLVPPPQFWPMSAERTL